MNPCHSDTFNWSRNYEDYEEEEEEEYLFERSFFKHMVKDAGIPPFDTKGIPDSVWKSFVPETGEDKTKTMIVNAMIYIIEMESPGIKLPDDVLNKHRTYDLVIKYLYESAIRRGFGTRAQRGQMLEQDLGM